jgi:esterase/lipase
MFSNLSESTTDSPISYPITDSRLPFVEYIKLCQTMIEERRDFAEADSETIQKIIYANSPFEYRPESSGNVRCGALLIHGLLDCPFTFREIGASLKSHGILARAILLPGHGTRPADLKSVTYHDWLQSVRYGVETLKQDVDEIYLIGYSTGAALSIYHAMQDERIAGIILLAPAVKVRAPIDLGASWNHLLNAFGKNRSWVYNLKEDDYAKYKSIAFNGVRQVSKLSATIREMRPEKSVKCPMYMIMSREDETISSHDAIDFFSSQSHRDSKMLLYTSIMHGYPDPRIIARNSAHPELNIAHLSHAGIIFSSSNQHYGQEGDAPCASLSNQQIIYGAYNAIEIMFYQILKKAHLAKLPRKALTYNPDFDYMADSISQFINRS